MKPTWSRGEFSGPNSLRKRFSFCLLFSDLPASTDLTHFRAIDSACSSIALDSQDRGCACASEANRPSKLSPGNTKGMISSSAHKREQSVGQVAATSLCIATPTIFSRCSSPYALSWERIKSTASSAFNWCWLASYFFSMKSSR